MVICSGNILQINSQLYLMSSTITLSETGTLQLTSAIGGFGGSCTFGINIGVDTLQIGRSGIFTGGISSNAPTRFSDAEGVLRLAGTATNAQNLINNDRIRSDPGGGTFRIDDLGGGFSQITVFNAIPEPSALLPGSLGVLAFMRRRL